MSASYRERLSVRNTYCSALLFGLAPAWYTIRATPASALRQTGRAGDTWFWRLFGKSLVAAQIALSILLVTAVAVFLNHLRNFDLGFQSDHVLLVTLDLDHSGSKRAQLAAPYWELLSRMQSVPQESRAPESNLTLSPLWLRADRLRPQLPHRKPRATP